VLPRLLAGEVYVWAAGVRHLMGKQCQPARPASQIRAKRASQRSQSAQNDRFVIAGIVRSDGALKESKCSN
jgi:hypothetical protein